MQSYYIHKQSFLFYQKTFYVYSHSFFIYQQPFYVYPQSYFIYIQLFFIYFDIHYVHYEHPNTYLHIKNVQTIQITTHFHLSNLNYPNFLPYSPIPPILPVKFLILYLSITIYNYVQSAYYLFVYLHSRFITTKSKKNSTHQINSIQY